MKLLLIKAMADSHLYSQFCWALRDALSELGHEAIVSDQSANVVGGMAQTGPYVAHLQSVRPDAVVSFSSFFGDLTLTGGVSLYDALGVKFIGWQLDHPIIAPKSLTRELQNRLAIYPHPNHLRYAQAVKLPGPGAVMLPGGQAPKAPLKDYGSRELSIFIAATWNGVPQRLWEQAEDSPGKRLLVGVIDALQRDPAASLLDAFNATSAKLRLGARLGDDPQFDAMMQGFLCEPLTYVRNVDRIEIIRSIVEAGLPVTLCGAGWRDFLGDRSNVTYVGRVHVDEIETFYGNAKVVINLNAGNGASERAVNAALAGAAVASDFSSHLDAFMGGGQGIAFFDRTKPRLAADVIGGLLESGEGEAVAHCGHERVTQSGLWRHRAAELVHFVERRQAKAA